jgi:RNA polymerase sigma factor (sigma-70 family)
MVVPAESLSDAVLVASLRSGDAAVATEFVRRFQGRVYGLALAITRDPSQAEDVAQESLLRAWKAAGKYDPARAAVTTWLLTITRNTAIDVVRARRTTPVAPEILEEVLSGTSLVADTAETAVRRLDSQRALRRLSSLHPNQARAVVLAVLGGCTAAEVGELEGIPLGTAKTRIRLGLMRLRDYGREGVAATS